MDSAGWSWAQSPDNAGLPSTIKANCWRRNQRHGIFSQRPKLCRCWKLLFSTCSWVIETSPFPFCISTFVCSCHATWWTTEEHGRQTAQINPNKRLLNMFYKYFPRQFHLNHAWPDSISVSVSIMIHIRNHKWAANFPFMSDSLLSYQFTYNHISPAVPWVLCRWCCRVAGTGSEVVVMVDHSQAVFVTWELGGWSKTWVSKRERRGGKKPAANSLICYWVCQKTFILWLPSR